MDSALCLSGSPLHWHLVFTKPSCEQIAKAHLERQGYRVYFPRVQYKALKRGAWRETVAALFPRYLFVQLNAAFQSLAPVRSTVGITNVVRFGVEYTIVPDRIVSALLSNEDPETRLHKLRMNSGFKPGSVVLIAKGALSGLEGIFESEDASGRVTVLLNLLGRESRVKIDSGLVVAGTA